MKADASTSHRPGGPPGRNGSCDERERGRPRPPLSLRATPPVSTGRHRGSGSGAGLPLLRTVGAVPPALATGRRRDAFVDAGELLKALSAPVRLAVVNHLATTGPLCVHELVDRLGVAQPLVSQHLRVLRAAAIVTAERRGREVAYSLADEHVAHIVADAIAHVQEEAPPPPAEDPDLSPAAELG